MRSSTRDKLVRLLKSKGGACLDKQWDSVSQKLTFRCSEGHEWAARVSSILYTGTWCPKCKIDSRRLGLAALQEMAASHGGECLATSYKTCKTTVEWKCAKGHIFRMYPKKVKKGHWCAVCKREEGTGYFVRLADVIEYVKTKGGRVLGNPTHTEELTEWSCAHGHTFTAVAKSIVTRDHFCPTCENVLPITIERIKEECENRGGQCLTDEYSTANTPMRFRCSEGHEWASTWRNIGISNTWCPECGKQRGSLKTLNAIARRHAGKALSLNYKNSRSLYAWECSKGHRFTATISRARGVWCPDCQIDQPDTPLSVHEQVAAKHNGRCLNAKSNKWVCAEGHVFKATIQAASLHWCPACKFHQNVEVSLEQVSVSSAVANN